MQERRPLWANLASLDLEKLELDQEIGHLPGGSGGVTVLKNEEGMRFTIKLSSSRDALKDEVFSDAFYERLGFNVPHFALYDVAYHLLPPVIQSIVIESLKEQKMVPNNNTKILFRIAQYIQSNSDLSQEDTRFILKKELPSGYVTDCFLSNTDVSAHYDNKNVLIDINSKVWRVDNGSTLRYRARGAIKELRTEVSELETMRSTTEMMREVYGQISHDEIQKQTHSLLQSRESLINLFYEMHEVIFFTQPELLLDILINRFQYLHEHVAPSLHPYAPAESEAAVDYSGAGIFLYAKIENEWCVLLGKRTNHEWWGAFGGASDKEDLFLKNTAVRESNEELLGKYKIHLYELDNIPSHDLIREKKGPINIPKFRMYFIEKNVIPAKEFNNVIKENPTRHEHMEFEWVPIESILNAEEVKHQDSSYGWHDTLAVTFIQSDKKKHINLHPPFADMLKQEAVKEQLSALILTGKLKNNRHTRSRISIHYDVDNKLYPTSPDHLTLMAERNQISQTVIQKGLMQRSLISLFKQKKVNIDEPMTKNIKTQSDIYLQAVLGEADFNNLSSTLSKVEKFNEIKLIDIPINEAQLLQFSQILTKEADYLSHRVFYHATDTTIAFWQDFITECRKQLEHQYESNFFFLRALDDFFMRYQNVAEFMKAYTNENRSINNYDKDYPEMAVSANFSLFGSDGNTDSATYFYYLTCKSYQPPDIKKLFDHFIQKLNLNADFNDLYVIFLKYKKQTGGNLKQIFVNKEDIDEIAYMARGGGSPNYLTVNGQEVTKCSEILNIIEANPSKYVNYIKTAQVRLYLKPTTFEPRKVTIFNYDAMPMTNEQQENYQMELTTFVSSLLQQMLLQYKKISTSSFELAHGKPSLYTQAGMVYEDRMRWPQDEKTMAEKLKEVDFYHYAAEGKLESIVNLFKNTSPSLDMLEQSLEFAATQGHNEVAEWILTTAQVNNFKLYENDKNRLHKLINNLLNKENIDLLIRIVTSIQKEAYDVLCFSLSGTQNDERLILLLRDFYLADKYQFLKYTNQLTILFSMEYKEKNEDLLKIIERFIENSDPKLLSLMVPFIVNSVGLSLTSIFNTFNEKKDIFNDRNTNFSLLIKSLKPSIPLQLLTNQADYDILGSLLFASKKNDLLDLLTVINKNLNKIVRKFYELYSLFNNSKQDLTVTNKIIELLSGDLNKIIIRVYDFCDVLKVIHPSSITLFLKTLGPDRLTQLLDNNYDNFINITAVLASPDSLETFVKLLGETTLEKLFLSHQSFIFHRFNKLNPILQMGFMQALSLESVLNVCKKYGFIDFFCAMNTEVKIAFCNRLTIDILSQLINFHRFSAEIKDKFTDNDVGYFLEIFNKDINQYGVTKDYPNKNNLVTFTYNLINVMFQQRLISSAKLLDLLTTIQKNVPDYTYLGMMLLFKIKLITHTSNLKDKQESIFENLEAAWKSLLFFEDRNQSRSYLNTLFPNSTMGNEQCYELLTLYYTFARDNVQLDKEKTRICLSKVGILLDFFSDDPAYQHFNRLMSDQISVLKSQVEFDHTIPTLGRHNNG